MRVDEAEIDLHGWLRAFYSCQGLGRSFVMDNAVQRPLPTYANFAYGRSNYAAVLKEVLQPLGLRLLQGKVVDAIVQMPSRGEEAPSHSVPVFAASSQGGNVAAVAASAAPDSASPVPAAVGLDSVPAAAFAPASRRLRAKASGLLRSSARQMGLSYSELLFSADKAGLDRVSGGSYPAANKVDHLWKVSAIASDSLGSLDFARVVDFSAWDTARVVFGGEIRRADSDINFDNGTSVTKYASIFDGLTVDVAKDRWSFLWRRDGNILEVPGAVGSCASGSSKVSFSARKGIPFLGKIPGLRWLFSYEQKYDDELLVAVCLEEVSGD